MLKRFEPKVQLAIASLILAISSAITSLSVVTVQVMLEEPSDFPAEFTAFKENVFKSLGDQSSKIEVLDSKLTNVKEDVSYLKSTLRTNHPHYVPNTNLMPDEQ